MISAPLSELAQRMVTYLCLVIGRNTQLIGHTSFDCATDSEASERALQYAGLIGAAPARIELWDGKRQVPVLVPAET